MLFARGLNYLAEMEQLVECLTVQEVCQPLTPAILELHQDLYQFHIVLQLGVNHFNILVVLAQERFEVSKGFFDSLCQISDSL